MLPFYGAAILLLFTMKALKVYRKRYRVEIDQRIKEIKEEYTKAKAAKEGKATEGLSKDANKDNGNAKQNGGATFINSDKTM